MASDKSTKNRVASVSHQRSVVRMLSVSRLLVQAVTIIKASYSCKEESRMVVTRNCEATHRHQADQASKIHQKSASCVSPIICRSVDRNNVIVDSDDRPIA